MALPSPSYSVFASARRLRSCVLNPERALHGTVFFAVPAAVVWWTHRVERISVTVIHIGWAGQMDGDRSAVVEGGVRVPGIIRAAARLQIQPVRGAAGRSDADRGRCCAGQCHLRPRSGRIVFSIQHRITDGVEKCDPRNRDTAALTRNGYEVFEFFARTEIVGVGDGGAGISAMRRKSDR